MTTAGSFETSVQEPTNLSVLEEIIAVQTLHLAPKHLGNISAGVKESLASMLLHWNEGLKAVPIVYTKADWNVCENAAILYDNPCVHVEVRVRWLALCPKAGVRCAGTVSNQGPEHLGLLLLNYFNVTIQASQLKSQYHWDDVGKTWMSNNEAVVSPGDKIEFEILDTATDGGVLVIFGSVDKMHEPKETNKKSSKKSSEPTGWSVTEKVDKVEKSGKDEVTEKAKKRKSEDDPTSEEKSSKKKSKKVKA